MAEQMCNMIKQGGSSVKIYDLGTGTSFNVSSIKGWQNFTTNNFVIVPSINMGGNILAPEGAGRAGSGASVSCSYNNSTGVCTIVARTSEWQDKDDGIHQSHGSPASVHAYLITDISKIEQHS